MRTLILGGSGIIGSYLKNHIIISPVNKDSNHTLFSPDSKILDLTKKRSVKNFFSNKKTFDNLIFLVGLAHSKGEKKIDMNLKK